MAVLNNGVSIFYNVNKLCKHLTPGFILPSLLNANGRQIWTNSVVCASAKMVPKESLYNRMKEKVYYHAFEKYIFRTKGYLLYRHSCDSLNYIKFMKDHEMPDTFFSWFLVTELHVWMLMVRLMAAGREGVETRHNLVGALWQDTDVRKKQLGNVSNSVVRTHIQEMGYQFNAAIIGYDEGLLGNDHVLAGAVWRRILQMKCENPELVENLVRYIRKSICELDNLPNELFLKSTKVKWPEYPAAEEKVT
ncbi:ubiquinol-cytochrome-c reductase complex assembly factor 1 [Microplitis mediator]|uniref:ubiquinol-cytochrome-c reductase complex assembly factor 1 n=1 Tax=Microplitis mediator TaxID=375433 RepID=UPI002553EC91|nr:ubiquinol-cytochrome-c reductase complex assembly factor 1 [Microplitis mediator]XP_057339116.1 ubiquinol-cytochrome-c reductase complex assembly factor 1 [Microplitis mediator]